MPHLNQGSEAGSLSSKDTIATPVMDVVTIMLENFNGTRYSAVVNFDAIADCEFITFDKRTYRYVEQKRFVKIPHFREVPVTALETIGFRDFSRID